MSNPTLLEFTPVEIPWQCEALRKIRFELDYTSTVHHILFSGAVGSSKSTLAQHLIVSHCLLFPGAIVGIGRLAMPRLKETLLLGVLNHIDTAVKYRHNKTTGAIEFENGSKILCFSWADGNFKKVRSYEFSMFVIEELTETVDEEIYKEITMRMRLKCPERIILSVTNPDEPSHWAYKRLIEQADRDDTHVFYSRTIENPYLPEGYIENLMDNMTEKEVLRYVEGQWLSLVGEGVYYAFDPEINYINHDYRVDERFPIHIGFDFNIALGKPFSAMVSQWIDGRMHIFDEFIIEGANTANVMGEMETRGLFEYRTRFLIHGDATGHSRSTNSPKSDYDIIQQHLARVRRQDKSAITYEKRVPRSNPPVRERHNIVNTYCKNANGDVKLFVYKNCPVSKEGLMMTKLKKGSRYIEDDNFYAQHVTTAIGYSLVYCHKHMGTGNDRTIRLF